MKIVRIIVRDKLYAYILDSHQITHSSQHEGVKLGNNWILACGAMIR